MALLGHSGSQAPQLMHASVIIIAMFDIFYKSRGNVVKTFRLHTKNLTSLFEKEQIYLPRDDELPNLKVAQKGTYKHDFFSRVFLVSLRPFRSPLSQKQVKKRKHQYLLI
jgi:hypothetical protein